MLDRVRSHWDIEADAVRHLPVGFGAHHWCASRDQRPVAFVTWDSSWAHHSRASLEDTYAAAAALRTTSVADLLVPPLATRAGGFTVPAGRGALSLTPWILATGPSDGPEWADDTAALLTRLHAVDPPARLPTWRPAPPDDLADRLPGLLYHPWDTGPLGPQMHEAVSDRLSEVLSWDARMRDLLSSSDPSRWVLTHGEPHPGNQSVVGAGRVLVDWESARLAPRERDLRPLWPGGTGWLLAGDAEPDWAMVELFDLEWRLDEIAQYAAWFAAPHGDGPDDRIALDGLRHELDRPGWCRP